MKVYLKYSILAAAIMLAAVGCRKEEQQSPSARTIRFVLYTEKDFSADQSNITFSVFIRNRTKYLLDSAFSTMKIKDIPRYPNKLIVEKKVPGDTGSELGVGFVYHIENVGISWHLDTCAAGSASKTVNFSFQ